MFPNRPESARLHPEGSARRAENSRPEVPRIRRAVQGDVSDLERLVELSVRGLQTRDYDDRVLDSALHNGLLAPDPRLIEDGTYYVAETAGRIVGAGGWSRHRNIVNGASDADGADDLLDPATEAAKIRAFYVRPECARMGIGSLLLNASEEAARRAGFRRLELLSTLTGAPLYAARGWQAQGRVEIPLPDGLIYPGIRMTKVAQASPDLTRAA
jgi:GNAT superfamily N-acetyltransferase